MQYDPRRNGDAGRVRNDKRLYEQAARLAQLGGWECDLATEELTWTDGVHAIFEVPLGSPLKRASIVELYFDDSRREMESMRAEVIRAGATLTLDANIRTYRGQPRWMRLSIGVAYEDGRPSRLFGAKQNITGEREAWARLRRMAERDPLTGLANRAVFDARWREVAGEALNVSALALIDLDHFKRINDGLGHAAGDECLRQVAIRLQYVFDAAALVARIGGDEFAVLLPASLEPASIKRVLRRASDALCRPVLWNGTRIDVGASIGATILARPHVRRASDLFAEADAALYAAKAAVANRCSSSATTSIRPLLRPVPGAATRERELFSQPAGRRCREGDGQDAHPGRRASGAG